MEERGTMSLLSINLLNNPTFSRFYFLGESNRSLFRLEDFMMLYAL